MRTVAHEPGSTKSYVTWWSVIPSGLLWSSLCASVSCRDFTIAVKESSTKNSGCLKDIRMPQAVLHNQLTNVTEKYPTALRSCISYCKLKWRKSISENNLMAKKQLNQGGTLKGSVSVASEFYLIEADLLRRRWTQEMKRKLSFDMILLNISIAYTKYYRRKLPMSAVLQVSVQ